MATADAAAVCPEGKEKATGFSISAIKPPMHELGRARLQMRLRPCERIVAIRAAEPSRRPYRRACPPAASRTRPTTIQVEASPQRVSARIASVRLRGRQRQIPSKTASSKRSRYLTMGCSRAKSSASIMATPDGKHVSDVKRIGKFATYEHFHSIKTGSTDGDVCLARPSTNGDR